MGWSEHEATRLGHTYGERCDAVPWLLAREVSEHLPWVEGRGVSRVWVSGPDALMMLLAGLSFVADPALLLRGPSYFQVMYPAGALDGAPEARALLDELQALMALDGRHCRHGVEDRPAGIALLGPDAARRGVWPTVAPYGRTQVVCRTTDLYAPSSPIAQQACAPSRCVLVVREYDAVHEGVSCLRVAESPAAPFFSTLHISGSAPGLPTSARSIIRTKQFAHPW